MKSARIPLSRGLNHRLMLLVASLLTSFLAARADERLFTYVQEAEVLPKGGLEFEQWLTHRRGKADGVFSRWDFREELEYGLTDRLSVAGYLNFKNTHSAGVTGRTDESRFEFEGVLTVLPQVHGSPDTRNGLELEEHEKIEVRLIAGINF